MNPKIISLTCPSRGNSGQHSAADTHFGFKFRCDSCGSASVLIINNRLYMPMPGERVCTSCRQVAKRNARFCQCGLSLVRKCINPNCLKEFPVDHEICDYCGWPQGTEPESNEGKKRKLIKAIRALSDPDPKVSSDAQKYLRELFIQMDFQELLDTIQLFDPISVMCVPILVDLVIMSKNRQARSKAWQIVKSIKDEFGYNSIYQKGLLKILTASDEDLIRDEAANILQLARPALIPDLIDAVLSTRSTQVRLLAWKILISFKYETVKNQLNRQGMLKILSDTDDVSIRNDIAAILPSVGPSLIPELIAIMDSKIDYSLGKLARKQ